jgi:hypothetical protein
VVSSVSGGSSVPVLCRSFFPDTAPSIATFADASLSRPSHLVVQVASTTSNGSPVPEACRPISPDTSLLPHSHQTPLRLLNPFDTSSSNVADDDSDEVREALDNIALFEVGRSTSKRISFADD